MSQMVGKPEVRQWFSFISHSVTKNARVDCTFMVYDVDGPGPTVNIPRPNNIEEVDVEKLQELILEENFEEQDQERAEYLKI